MIRADEDYGGSWAQQEHSSASSQHTTLGPDVNFPADECDTASVDQASPATSNGDQPKQLLRGAKLAMAIISLDILMFLAALDSTI
ncbi:hypothetical protein IWQ57_001759, partial [Coemansia nantahalensis]